MGLDGADGEEWLAKFDRFAVLSKNFNDNALCFGLDFVHHLHRLDDANDRVFVHFLARFHVGC